MAFKLPVLKSKENVENAVYVVPNLCTFTWEEVKNKRRLGEGSFGDVYTGEYNGQTVVVKKTKRQTNRREMDLFIKEIRILNELKCKNVVKVEGFCAQPLAVMLEYLYFDFQPFGIDSEPVASLAEYLDFIVSGDYVNQLAVLQLKIAKDITSATAHLHKNGIVHRDIKPANILVSNKHYCSMKDTAQIANAFRDEGIICKLADFGESRSKLNQTAKIQHTRTTNLERGTFVYNPPEIVTANHGAASFSLEDLKRADVWSLGMVMFVLVNPDIEYPYASELKKLNITDVSRAEEKIKSLMKVKKKPVYSEKYIALRTGTWIKIEKAFQLCATFQPEQRPSAGEVLQTLTCVGASQDVIENRCGYDNSSTGCPLMDNSPRNFRATKSSIGSSGPHSRENITTSEGDDKSHSDGRTSANSSTSAIYEVMAEPYCSLRQTFAEDFSSLNSNRNVIEKCETVETPIGAHDQILLQDEPYSIGCLSMSGPHSHKSETNETADNLTHSNDRASVNSLSSVVDITTNEAVSIVDLARDTPEPSAGNSAAQPSGNIEDFQPSNDKSDEDDDSLSSSDDAVGTVHISGEAYKGDSKTPVLEWRKTAYSSQEIAAILLSAYEPEQMCVSQPINVSHNVSFLVDTRSLAHKDDLKCDDMGAWKHNGSPKCLFRVEANSRGKRRISAVDKKSNPMCATEEVYELRRAYYKNLSDSNVRKIVSKLYDPAGEELPLVLLQYMFSGEEHELKNVRSHGNSKFKSSYRRILPSTREKMKQSVKQNEKTVKEVLDDVYVSSGDVTMARSLGELPRGPSDIYNARRLAKQSTGVSNASKNVAGLGESSKSERLNVDTVWALLERAKREEEQSKDNVFIRDCAIHPDLFIVLANDEQLNELMQFCTNQRCFSVFGIDPTFNIFDRNISLTVTTYRNLKLEHINTGKSPVFIGPLLMHQRKDWKTYSKFAHALLTAKPELEGILACGTDGEKALIEGFQRNMRFAVFLRCFLHFKDNIKRELTDRGIPTHAKKQFLDQIFGIQDGTTKYMGLVDCNSEEEFDSKLAALKAKWEEMETLNGSNQKTKTFFDWFLCEKANDMKDSMLKPVRVEAGLGDPPMEYKNNDPESANFMIKHGLHFNANKPHEFVEKIKNIVETQQRNEERAVFGRGPYRVRKEFEHLKVDDAKRSHLNHQQLMKKVLEFKKANMNDMKDILYSAEPETQESTKLGLNITAKESGITTIPATILESIFERASNLIATPGSVIPKPGAEDGSFIVAGTCNKIHSVTPGKGGSLSCDRLCVNFSTKICEHVLAVAQKKEMLDEFITWFKKRRKRATMMDMVEQGGPKTAGKKPSGRKRTNAKSKPVTRYEDLLTNDETDSRAMTSQQPVSYKQHQNVYPPQAMTLPSGPQIPSKHHQSVHPSHNLSSACPIGPQMPSMRQPSAHSPSASWSSILYSDSQTPSSCPNPSTHSAAMGCNATEPRVSPYPLMTRFPDQSSNVSGNYVLHHPVTTSAYQFSRTPHIVLPNSPVFQNAPYYNTPSSNTTSQIAGSQQSFYLKWVGGTKVSKCYGCGGVIKNPPEKRPDDLIIFCRDIREYRDRITGQLQQSSSAQNVHFHLRRECLLMRYPSFHVGLLSITPAFQAALHPEHLVRLSENFGWSQN